MRDIKFKGKRIDNGEWVYGGIWINKTVSRITVYVIDKYGNSVPVMPETVGQYTGLKDKRGNEIYEGDICESKIHTPSKMVVKFIKGVYCLTSPKIEGYPIDINYFYDSIGCMIEVIGNIHESEETK